MSYAWRKGESTIKPSLVEELDGHIYLRKDIKEVEVNEGDDPRFSYDEAIITPAEYVALVGNGLNDTNTSLEKTDKNVINVTSSVSDLESIVADMIGGASAEENSEEGK